jgi:hypothetical protein
VGGAVAALLLILALIDRPTPASGPPPEPFAFPPPGISAIGSVAVRIPRDTRRSQVVISRAVAAANERAVPRAIKAATQRARAMAVASWLRLGAIYGVAAETSRAYAWSAEPGTFGPGHYGGHVRRFARFASCRPGAAPGATDGHGAAARRARSLSASR